MTTRDDTTPYLRELEGVGARRSGDPEWMRGLREAATARFREIGFPTPRDEDWKYTNVTSWVNHGGPVRCVVVTGFGPASRPESVDLCAEIVFRDGRYDAAASTLTSLPEGCRVGRISDAIAAGDAEVGRHLARHASFDRNGFTALSTAMLQDGAYVVLAPRTSVPAPIAVTFETTALCAETSLHPRMLVVCGAESRAAIVECHRAEGGSRVLVNAVGELVLEEGAALDHVRVIADEGGAAHVATTEVVQGRDSRYASSALSLRGSFVRHDVNVRLSGEGAECSLDGLYLAGGRDFVDHHTTIDHAVPHCASRELYKGILGGEARAVFNGKVIVRAHAQKSDAQQTNRNLLLSGRAEIDTKPELQIFADDVKCAHGAAIGQLDDQALFYLKSRGVGERLGRHLLTLGFGQEMVDRIAVPSLHPWLGRALSDRLRADLTEDR